MIVVARVPFKGGLKSADEVYAGLARPRSSHSDLGVIRVLSSISSPYNSTGLADDFNHIVMELILLDTDA